MRLMKIFLDGGTMYMPMVIICALFVINKTYIGTKYISIILVVFGFLDKLIPIYNLGLVYEIILVIMG